MYNNDLIAYYQEAAKYPLLTEEEEKELLQKAQSGDKDAREKLITHNLKLVLSIVKDYTGPGVDTLDLIQQGNIGLIYSIDHYDPTRGAKLSTAASYGIKKYIIKYYFEQSRTIRKPQWQQEMTSKIRDAEQALSHTLGRKPTIEEVAEYVDALPITVERVLQDNAVKQVSLHTPLNDDGDTVEDLIAAEEEVNSERMEERYKNAVKTALSYLSEDEANFLRALYGVDGAPMKTQTQLSEERGYSREYGRQMKEAALRKLRHPDILQDIRSKL